MKVTTNDGGLNYKITEANLTRGTWYSVDISKSGYEFNVPNIYVPIPYEPIPVQMSILITGYFNKIIIKLNYNVPNIQITDLTFQPETTVMSVSTTDIGLTYIIEADFAPNTTYKISIEKYGYVFTTTSFKTQKEFLSTYAMQGVIVGLGLDGLKYRADVPNARILGGYNKDWYLCVPVIDTETKNSSNLYGILFCDSAQNGTSDWHFLNTPVNMIGSYYDNKDLRFMTINNRSSSLATRIYFFCNVRSDLLDSYYDKIGDLYVAVLDDYVDGKALAWTQLIDESYWYQGNEFVSDTSNKEMFLGIGPTAMLGTDIQLRITGYKVNNYYQSASESYYFRDFVQINPNDNKIQWKQTYLSKYTTQTNPATWFIRTGSSINMSITTRSSTTGKSYVRMKNSTSGHPYYEYDILVADLLALGFPENRLTGFDRNNYQFISNPYQNRLWLCNNDYSSTNLSEQRLPRIAYNANVQDTRYSCITSKYNQDTDGYPTSDNIFCITLNKNENFLKENGFNNPVMFWALGSNFRKWYPREIIKKKDGDRTLSGFDIIANFNTSNSGLMVIETAYPYIVYYLPTSENLDDVQLFKTDLFVIEGEYLL